MVRDPHKTNLSEVGGRSDGYSEGRWMVDSGDEIRRRWDGGHNEEE